MEKLRVPLLVVIAAWFLAAYAPGTGTGFIKDDFNWIQQGSVGSFAGAVALLSRNTGFYRPLVTLSFTVDRALFGLAPLGYGLTNALLAILVAVAIARLARALGLSRTAGVFAGGLWLLNPHGINMALLWTSGRTSLMLTLFAVLAATAVLRRQHWQTALLVLLALLSKEEAVALPFVLLAWTFLWTDGTWPGVRRLVVPALALFGPLVAYLVLRAQSGAFTPASAPPFYRFSTAPGLLAFNVFSYVDRAATLSVVVVLIAWLAVRRKPRLQATDWRLLAMAVVWIVGGYALTVWLPVRSSLYALLPSVAVVLVASMWLSRLVEAGGRVAVVPTIVVLALVAAVAVPIYWSRNERWLAPARVSAAVLPQLKAIVEKQPADTTIIIRDRDNPRESISSAFGTLLPAAVTLATGRPDVRLWLVPPPGDWQLAGWHEPAPGAPTAIFTLRKIGSDQFTLAGPVK